MLDQQAPSSETIGLSACSLVVHPEAGLSRLLRHWSYDMAHCLSLPALCHTALPVCAYLAVLPPCLLCNAWRPFYILTVMPIAWCCLSAILHYPCVLV